jgi:hypothetical protein
VGRPSTFIQDAHVDETEQLKYSLGHIRNGGDAPLQSRHVNYRSSCASPGESHLNELVPVSRQELGNHALGEDKIRAVEESHLFPSQEAGGEI